MIKRPYLSFVVVARNDNYGGDFLHRINVFVKTLITLIEKYELLSELIIVEWNPPEDRPRLKDAILWPTVQRKFCHIRIIEVSRELHEKLPNPGKLPLLEYIGKNVGVRRARGEFILVTNPDIIFNEAIIKYLASQPLSSECFYRINRYDIKSSVPLDTPVEKLLEYCENNIIRVCGYWYTNEGNLNIYRYLRAFAGHLKQKVLWFPFVPPHTNASGDFLLMHRDRWIALRGYSELKGWHHIDSLIVIMALFSGLRQIIFKEPLRIYHMDHPRAEGGKKPWTQDVEIAYQKLIKERKPIVFNNETWGLGNENLPETSI